MADYADYYVRFNPGTDVALLNGMMHIIIKEGLYDEQFIEERTEQFDQLREAMQHYTPHVVARLTGVSEQRIIAIARAYGQAERAMIFWGMGISQHTTGTDNARCLINLALLTGILVGPELVCTRCAGRTTYRALQTSGSSRWSTRAIRVSRMRRSGRNSNVPGVSDLTHSQASPWWKLCLPC